MNRREWLKSMSALAVGAIAGPSLLMVFDAHAASQKPDAKPQFFNPAQYSLVGAVSDIVIPRTDTPGAVDAGVPLFIDQLFKAVYNSTDQSRYVAALSAFDKAGGKPFMQMNDTQRKALVARLHTEALAVPRGGKLSPADDFVLMTKNSRCLASSYRSRAARRCSSTTRFPQPWKADIPLSQAGNGPRVGGRDRTEDLT